MNEHDKRDLTIVIAICVTAIVVTSPKAVAMAVASAAVLIGGTIWGARSLQG